MTDFLNKIKKIKGQNFVFYSHLGLGDQIILSGAINYLSKKYEKIYLVSYEKFKNSLNSLYNNNSSIEMVFLPEPFNKLKQDKSEIEEFVKNYGEKNNLEILKVGYENQIKRLRFYESFYKQLKIEYQISYDYFSLNNDELMVKKLSSYLKNYFEIEGNFKLIHNEHSSGFVDLKNINEKNNIFVTRDSDPYNNLFLYEDLIKNASEIHCINSSFAHLVDRLNTNGKLIYHEVLGSRLKFKKEWSYINY